VRAVRAAGRRLDGIPGFGVRTAQDLIGEIGVDMAAFPTAGHLCSWARLAPRVGLIGLLGARLLAARPARTMERLPESRREPVPAPGRDRLSGRQPTKYSG